MKKNYIFKTLLFAIPLAAFVLVSFSGGINGARTGSPGDSGGNCTQCHSGTVNSGSSTGSISTNIPAGGYALGQTYQVTVSATSSATKYGFLATAEKSDNSKVGVFAAPDGNSQAQDTGTRIGHTASSNTSNSWTFNWTAPATNEGDITFYAAINAANNDGATSGDEILTISSSSVGSVLSIEDAKRLDFEMYPNPSADNLNIQLPSGVNNASVTLFDYTGRTVKNQEVSSSNKEINVQDLASGIYIVKVKTENKIGTQQFIKE